MEEIKLCGGNFFEKKFPPTSPMVGAAPLSKNFIRYGQTKKVQIWRNMISVYPTAVLHLQICIHFARQFQSKVFEKGVWGENFLKKVFSPQTPIHS